MKKISDLKLEQWLLGELSAEDSAQLTSEIENNPELRSRIDAMKQQSQELFQKHPPERFHTEVEQKIQLLEAQQEYAQSQRFSPVHWRMLAGVLALGLALVVIVPPLGTQDPDVGTDNTEQGSGYRTKGETIHLMAHRVDDSGQTSLADGVRVQAGDRIQLSIDKATGRSFVVFSIDGRGVLSEHYPRESKPKIETEAFFSLPTSYRLDDAPDFEDFYLVSSAQLLDRDDILKKANAAQQQPDFQESFRSMLSPQLTINRISLQKEKP